MVWLLLMTVFRSTMKRTSGVERKYEVYSLKNQTAPSNLMLKPSLVLKDMRLEN